MPWVRTDDSTLTADNNVAFMPAGPEVSIAPSSSTAGLWTFSVANWPGVRVCIYALQPSRDVCRRISEMAAIPIEPQARSFFSWPIDTIVNQDGTLIGYLASAAQNLSTLTSLLTAEKSLPYDKKICIAKNLCVALAAFHQNGFVFGNLTPDSILVEPRTCRVFLDPGTNAQFLASSGDLFTCNAGVREYLAPEVHRFLSQGGTLRGIIPRFTASDNEETRLNKVRSVFSTDTDLFALGVIIFTLLNDNRHPLSCLIEGEPGIAKLTSRSLPAQRIPRPMPLMMGQRPRTSLRRRTIPIPNYRLAWFRAGRAGDVYDKCFADLASTPVSRPTASEWYTLLERKSAGIRARLSRQLNKLRKDASSVSDEAPAAATDYYSRQAIESQYPPDLVGSEPLSSPRVFWRTTLLFSLGIGLAAAACALTLSPYATKLGCTAFILGSLIGMLLTNAIAGKKRGLSGYRPSNYAASFAGSLLASAILGVLAGGV